jgi:polygalacturonase
MTRKKLIFKLLPIVIYLSTALAVAAGSGKFIVATKTGVIGDGATVNTVAIQKMIDACSAGGGGTVQFPAGRFVTGTIQLKDNVILHLDENAVLLGSTNAADYRNVDPFKDGNGHPLGHALIVAVDAKNVGIEGKGTVDGQSPALKKTQNPYAIRPFLLRWIRCTNVTVRDVRLTNPGSWTLNFFQTKGAVVEAVTIRSRDLGMPNNDGIDLDSCEDVQVRNCDIISGDDSLCIKATSAAKPSRDIEATNCKLSSRCNAIKLGTESIGGFENISVSDCQITNTKMSGIALYEVDGADLRNVTISNVTMDGVTLPISIRLGARLKTFREGDQPKPAPGQLRDVTIKNVSAKNIEMIGMLINGVPGHPVENLTLENIQLELPGGGTGADAKIELPEKEATYPEWNMFGKVMPASGVYARHVRDVTFKNVQARVLKDDARPPVVLIDAKGVTPADFATATAATAR